MPANAQVAQGILKPTFFEYEATKPLPLYDQPAGKEIGTAVLNFKVQWGHLWMTAYQMVDTDTLHFDIEQEREYIDRESAMLKYYAVQNGYAKVLASRAGTYWMSLEKMKPITWIEQLTNYSGYLLYGYDRYRLRDRPSTEGNTIVTLDEKRHDITTFTGQIEGSWAEAIVSEVKIDITNNLEECYNLSQFEVLREYRGWIKLVDDAGQYNDIKYNHSC